MKIREFLTLLTRHDKEEVRVLRQFTFLVFCIELSIALYALALVLVAPQHLGRLWLVGIGVPFLFATHWLIQRQQLRQAQILFVWTLWLLTTISAFTAGGVHSPTFFIYTIIILLAGLLLERWAGIAFAIGSIVSGLIMVAMLADGPHLGSAFPLDAPVLRWLLGSLTFAIAAILQYIEIGSLSNALMQARTNEQALAESHQALQARTQELEKREQALHQSETQLRTLVQALPDAIIRARQDGTILDARAPTDFIFRVPPEQLIGRKIQESFPPELAAQLLQMNRQAIETQAVQVYEYSISIDGEIRWRESRVLSTSANEIIAIVRDITRRKRAIEILLHSEDRYRKLVESSPDAILLYRGQRVLFTNPAGLRLWKAGASRELVGKSFHELIHSADHATAEVWEDTLLVQGKWLLNAPQKIVCLDGTVIDVEVTAAAYQDVDGVAVQAIYRDVTERKQAETRNQQLLHEIAAQRSQLRALHVRLARIEENERKRLAHELHDRVAQTLTGLNLNLNVLQRFLQNEVAAESRVHLRLSDAITLVEQTTVQIRKIMADLRPPVLDDYGLLATLEWYASQLTMNTGLRIEVLGEVLEPRPAEYVELTLFRIVQEALTNVVQHALATQAMIVLTADATSIYITVSDDGVGIEQTEQEPAAQRQKWGLITIRERAEAIGGRCEIESYPFLGTAVMVEVQR